MLRRKRVLQSMSKKLFQRSSPTARRTTVAAAGTLECFGYLLKAVDYYKQALKMFPLTAVRELETTHNQVGNVFDDEGQTDAALHHYRESIRYCEAMRGRFGSGQTRRNVAITLAKAGRFTDAYEWAQAALRDFQVCENAEQGVVKTSIFWS